MTKPEIKSLLEKTFDRQIPDELETLLYLRDQTSSIIISPPDDAFDYWRWAATVTIGGTRDESSDIPLTTPGEVDHLLAKIKHWDGQMPEVDAAVVTTIKETE